MHVCTSVSRLNRGHARRRVREQGGRRSSGSARRGHAGPAQETSAENGGRAPTCIRTTVHATRARALLARTTSLVATNPSLSHPLGRAISAQTQLQHRIVLHVRHRLSNRSMQPPSSTWRETKGQSGAREGRGAAQAASRTCPRCLRRRYLSPRGRRASRSPAQRAPAPRPPAGALSNRRSRAAHPARRSPAAATIGRISQLTEGGRAVRWARAR